MANKNIRGLTVEIDGNTVKLQSALKDTEKSIRSVESDLKSVNQMLKFDPTNTDLLRQKQELLGKAVEENKDKLETLKKAQEQLKDAGVSETSSEYIALQQEIQKPRHIQRIYRNRCRIFLHLYKRQRRSLKKSVRNLSNLVHL